MNASCQCSFKFVRLTVYHELINANELQWQYQTTWCILQWCLFRCSVLHTELRDISERDLYTIHEEISSLSD